jgi:uncharacterized phage infection (PIP) family protein YhgE
LAVKATWKQGKLEESQAKIAHLSGQLSTHLCAVYLPSISDKLDAVGDDLAALDGRLEQDMLVVTRQLKRVETIAQGTSDTANKTKDHIVQLHA